jgi:hypothetical protein
MTELAIWDQARAALAKLAHAVHLDEVVKIRDDTARLRAVARIAEDDELERTATEIHLRAMQRLGELCRDLDKAQGARTDKPLPNAGKKSKADTLAGAGISTSTAHRCEQLTGSTKAQREDAQRAAEEYFGERRDAALPINFEGLKAAVTDALMVEVEPQPEVRQVAAKVVHVPREARRVHVEIVRPPAPAEGMFLHVNAFTQGVEAAGALLDHMATEQGTEEHRALLERAAARVREIRQH